MILYIFVDRTGDESLEEIGVLSARGCRCIHVVQEQSSKSPLCAVYQKVIGLRLQKDNQVLLPIHW